MRPAMLHSSMALKRLFRSLFNCADYNIEQSLSAVLWLILKMLSSAAGIAPEVVICCKDDFLYRIGRDSSAGSVGGAPMRDWYDEIP